MERGERSHKKTKGTRGKRVSRQGKKVGVARQQIPRRFPHHGNRFQMDFSGEDRRGVRGDI
jgi:hypothetical protein